jgi:hypothetical protein
LGGVADSTALKLGSHDQSLSLLPVRSLIDRKNKKQDWMPNVYLTAQRVD